MKVFISSNHELDFEIIADKAPSENFLVGNLTLKDLILAVSDKDTRRFASSIFTKYPIESFYRFEEIFNEDMPSYQLFGNDAINIYIAHRLKYISLSLPFEEYKTDTLSLQDDNEETLYVDNFYGSNQNILTTYLPAAPDEDTSYLDKILALNGETKTYLGDSFKREFKSSPERIQKHIYNMFETAYNAGILVPCIADSKMIKKFHINDNKYVFELRSMSEEGFRACIDSENGFLYIGLFYTKANYNTNKQQTERARCAYNIIKELKLKSNDYL